MQCVCCTKETHCISTCTHSGGTNQRSFWAVSSQSLHPKGGDLDSTRPESKSMPMHHHHSHGDTHIHTHSHMYTLTRTTHTRFLWECKLLWRGVDGLGGKSRVSRREGVCEREREREREREKGTRGERERGGDRMGRCAMLFSLSLTVSVSVSNRHDDNQQDAMCV